MPNQLHRPSPSTMATAARAIAFAAAVRSASNGPALAAAFTPRSLLLMPSSSSSSSSSSFQAPPSWSRTPHHRSRRSRTLTSSSASTLERTASEALPPPTAAISSPPDDDLLDVDDPAISMDAAFGNSDRVDVHDAAAAIEYELDRSWIDGDFGASTSATMMDDDAVEDAVVVMTMARDDVVDAAAADERKVSSRPPPETTTPPRAIVGAASCKEEDLELTFQAIMSHFEIISSEEDWIDDDDDDDEEEEEEEEEEQLEKAEEDGNDDGLLAVAESHDDDSSSSVEGVLSAFDGVDNDVQVVDSQLDLSNTDDVSSPPSPTHSFVQTVIAQATGTLSPKRKKLRPFGKVRKTADLESITIGKVIAQDEEMYVKDEEDKSHDMLLVHAEDIIVEEVAQVEESFKEEESDTHDNLLVQAEDSIDNSLSSEEVVLLSSDVAGNDLVVDNLPDQSWADVILSSSIDEPLSSSDVIAVKKAASGTFAETAVVTIAQTISPTQPPKKLAPWVLGAASSKEEDLELTLQAIMTHIESTSIDEENVEDDDEDDFELAGEYERERRSVRKLIGSGVRKGMSKVGKVLNLWSPIYNNIVLRRKLVGQGKLA